jgi:hypothetical protein
MAKADRVYSTPPTNTSARHSRRSILGAIAGSAAAAGGIAGLSPGIAAAPAVDPIYAVIETHRKACTEHNEAVHIHMAFEEVGMTGEKLEKYNSLVAETDATYDRLDDVGCDLINTRPTTLAGILALCRYVKPFFGESDPDELPHHILFDDDSTEYPAEALFRVMGNAIEDLMKAAAGKAVLS